MNCQKIRQLLPAFAAQGLEGSNEHKVKAHLDHCADCKGSLAKTQKLRALLALKQHEQPDEFFFRTYLSEFHRRLYSQILQKPSFLGKLNEIFLWNRPARFLWRVSSAVLMLVLTMSFYMTYVTAPNHSTEFLSSGDDTVRQNIGIATRAPSVVEVESRFNQLVLADKPSHSIYVLDRLNYEPSTRASAILQF